MTKICTKCGVEKSLREFRWRKDQGRYVSRCKKCERERARKYYAENSEKLKTYSKEYRANNKEYYLHKLKEYREQNKEKLSARRKNYYVENKEACYERQKKWRAKNPLKVKAQNKRYRAKPKNKKRHKELCRIHYAKDTKKNALKSKKWRDVNKEKAKAIAIKSFNKRYQIIENKLNNSMSGSIYKALKKNKAGRHWESIVSYNLQDLKEHLEKQFKDGMDWTNYSKDGWHIDHIIPIDFFEFNSYDSWEFKYCWSLDNLQPLWAYDNISKGNKITNQAE